jgi:hypothetical protein
MKASTRFQEADLPRMRLEPKEMISPKTTLLDRRRIALRTIPALFFRRRRSFVARQTAEPIRPGRGGQRRTSWMTDEAHKSVLHNPSTDE